MGSTTGRGQGGLLGAVPIGGRCPGAFFWDFWTAGFVRLVPCRWGLLPFLATIGASPLMTRGCLCLFLAWFGFLLALALSVFGAAAPILALLASLAILPGPGLGFCFLALAPVLAFCPFVSALGCLLFFVALLIGDLTGGGASGDVQGCPFV